MNKPLYAALLVFTILATVGGFITLWPRAAASYENVLGYRSVCTFAPAATFFCFFLAGLSCFLRATFVKDPDGPASEKFRRHARNLRPLAVLLILGLAASAWFGVVKARYTGVDAGAGVTEVAD